MSRAEFFYFLRGIGGLISSHRKIEVPIYDYGCQCNDGWLELIAELIQELVDSGWTREIVQIKEKFGGLRFMRTDYPKTDWRSSVKMKSAPLASAKFVEVPIK